MLLTSNQLRAARALLGLKQEELADRANVAIDAIKKFETGATAKLQAKTQDAILRVFHDRVEFLDNQGVRFRPIGVEVYEGKERFEEFYTFMYEHLERYGGEVCLSTVDEKLFSQYREPESFETHKQRMKALVDSGKVTFRVLATDSKHFHTASYAQYRWQPEQSMAPTAFYAFGDCLALVSFDHEPAPYVVLHKSGPFAEAYRHSFNLAWKNGRVPPKEKK